MLSQRGSHERRGERPVLTKEKTMSDTTPAPEDTPPVSDFHIDDTDEVVLLPETDDTPDEEI